MSLALLALTAALIGSLSVRVIDGDTLELCAQDVDVCEVVRIANIDAPEMRGAGCPFEDEGGDAAAAAAVAILARADAVRIEERLHKSHGRTVARVTVDVDGRARDLGLMLIAEGVAVWRAPDDRTGDAPAWCGR